MFRARMGARKERKWFILIGIQRGRLAAKVRPGEARFGPELDWEKLWRDQVVGVKMSETNGNKLLFFSRDSEAAFGSESATRGGSFWTRIRWGKAVVWRQVFRARMGARKERKWFILIGIQRGRLAAKVRPGEARFGPELDWEKLWRDQVVGVKMSETNGNKLLFFSRDSEAAFGSESATRGGSFWTRITLGKAVAAPGVRGQDAREKWKKTIFVLEGSRSSVWHRKCDQGRLVLN